MPTPRYLTSLLSDQLRSLDQSTTEQDPAVVGITLEEIETVQADRYGFRGFFVRARAFLSADVGDRVYVQWQGGQPITILDVMTRRGSAVDEPDVVGEGIEELFLFTDGAASDVFYRNAQQVTRLNLWAVLPATALAIDIGWGVDGEAFFVQLAETVPDPRPGGTVTVVPYYEVFTLSPSQVSAPRGAQRVSATRVKTIHTVPKGLPYFDDGWENDVRTIHAQNFFYGVQQPLLSETLQLYGVCTVTVSVGGFGGIPAKIFDALGSLSLIMQPDGTLVYKESIVDTYLAQKDSVIDTDQEFRVTHATRLLSWSDRTLAKRRWFSVYSTRRTDIVADVDVLLESAFRSDVYQAGAVTVAVAAGIEYTSPDTNRRANYAPFVIPTMSTERYVVVDQPTEWDLTAPIIRARNIDMLDLTAGTRTTIFQWVKAMDDARVGYAPKVHGLDMLAPGVLYAFPESPVTLDPAFSANIAVPPGRYYDIEHAGPPPLLEEGTLAAEREKFVGFTTAGAVSPTFLTGPSLTEDSKLRGKGNVSTKLPTGFDLVLANSAIATPTTDQRVVVRRRASVR